MEMIKTLTDRIKRFSIENPNEVDVVKHIATFLLGISTCALFATGLTWYADPSNRFSDYVKTHIQRGYAKPDKLEIRTRDLDDDGFYEVYLDYHAGTERTLSYLIKCNDQTERISLNSYYVQPPKIIEGEDENNGRRIWKGNKWVWLSETSYY